MSIPTSPVTAPASMRLHTRSGSSGTVVVAVAGEVDMATAPALKAALLDALVVHRPTVIDVDLSACTFLDCSGVRVLVAAHTTAQATGCQMGVRHPRRLVRLVLEVIGLLDMFTANDDRPDDLAEQPAPSHELAKSGAASATSRPCPPAASR